MKKKHLKALNTLEKWLKDNNSASEETVKALNHLKDVVADAQESDLVDLDEPLPPPQELAQEPNAIGLFTDGGCRGNPGPGAFAFVLQKYDGQVLGEGVEFEVMTTNNRMELLGAIRGLEEAKHLLPSQKIDPLLTKIKVMTDSKYVVDGMKSWVQGWKARGWKKADNKAPENLDLWQILDQVRDHFMQVEWIWVKGHAGHPQNEYCDRKANEIMDKNI